MSADEYTLNEIRNDWAFSSGELGGGGDQLDAEKVAAFDRALAAHDAAILGSQKSIPGASKMENLKSALHALGFKFDEDYSIESGDSGDEINFIVRVPMDEFELPEELRAYAVDDHEIERAVWKGNTEKKTWNGANFELALRNYMNAVLNTDPEMIKLRGEDLLNADTTREYLETYQATVLKVWERIHTEPQVAAWLEDLEKNFY